MALVPWPQHIIYHWYLYCTNNLRSDVQSCTLTSLCYCRSKKIIWRWPWYPGHNLSLSVKMDDTEMTLVPVEFLMWIVLVSFITVVLNICNLRTPLCSVQMWQKCAPNASVPRRVFWMASPCENWQCTTRWRLRSHVVTMWLWHCDPPPQFWTMDLKCTETWCGRHSEIQINLFLHSFL